MLVHFILDRGRLSDTQKCRQVNLIKVYELLTKYEIKMAGYWPSPFFACLWTEKGSSSFNLQIKNEANIQPS